MKKLHSELLVKLYKFSIAEMIPGLKLRKIYRVIYLFRTRKLTCSKQVF